MEAINLPLYQRIARQLKSAIERGELTPGSRLPASRVYAQEQGVSRATIENAWGELVAQGWLERRGQAGTFVSERLSPRQLAPVPPVQPAAPTEPLPFQMGLPALDLFPRGQWARVMGRRLRTQSRFDLAPGDPGGDPLLRQAIVDYLRLSRSIDCQPDQVLITGSYAASMNLILRTLAQPGQHMWMEDPGIPLSGRSSRLGSWRWMRFPWTTKGWTSAGASVITRRRDLPCSHQPIRVRWGSRCRFPDAASCWRGPRSATRGSLRTITIASFAITANRCRR